MSLGRSSFSLPDSVNGALKPSTCWQEPWSSRGEGLLLLRFHQLEGDGPAKEVHLKVRSGSHRKSSETFDFKSQAQSNEVHQNTLTPGQPPQCMDSYASPMECLGVASCWEKMVLPSNARALWRIGGAIGDMTSAQGSAVKDAGRWHLADWYR